MKQNKDTLNIYPHREATLDAGARTRNERTPRGEMLRVFESRPTLERKDPYKRPRLEHTALSVRGLTNRKNSNVADILERISESRPARAVGNAIRNVVNVGLWLSCKLLETFAWVVHMPKDRGLPKFFQRLWNLGTILVKVFLIAPIVFQFFGILFALYLTLGWVVVGLFTIVPRLFSKKSIELSDELQMLDERWRAGAGMRRHRERMRKFDEDPRWKDVYDFDEEDDRGDRR